MNVECPIVTEYKKKIKELEISRYEILGHYWARVKELYEVQQKLKKYEKNKKRR